MAGSLAGKFVDYYEVLGVDPKASSEVIQEAYRTLSHKYRPVSGPTPDPEKFRQINEAYDALSDPTNRAMFDKVRGGNESEPELRFSGAPFFDSLRNEVPRRMAILCVLYDRRRLAPFTPSVSMRQMEALIVATTEELAFSVWYLKQRGWVSQDDRSSMQITVEGMEHLEGNLPNPAQVALFLKDQPAPPPEPEKAAVPDTQIAGLLAAAMHVPDRATLASAHSEALEKILRAKAS